MESAHGGYAPEPRGVVICSYRIRRGKEVSYEVSRNKYDPGLPAWLKATVTAMIAVAAVAGAGHADTGPAARPATACVQLQALSSQVSAAA
jgi:hypothetical protein